MDKLRNTSRRLTPFALALLRVTFGVVMAVHGWFKLANYGEWVETLRALGVPEAMAPLAIAGELGGGIGLVLGLLTPIAAFGVLCTMITAIATVHAHNGLLAQNGGFEYPLILAALALFFVVRGAGPISLDHAIFRSRKGRPIVTEPTRPPFGRESYV